MNEKDLLKLHRRIQKLFPPLLALMEKHNPDEIFEAIITDAPPEDVELLARFCSGMMGRFAQKMCEIVWQTDAENNEEEYEYEYE